MLNGSSEMMEYCNIL